MQEKERKKVSCKEEKERKKEKTKEKNRGSGRSSTQCSKDAWRCLLKTQLRIEKEIAENKGATYAPELLIRPIKRKRGFYLKLSPVLFLCVGRSNKRKLPNNASCLILIGGKK